MSHCEDSYVFARERRKGVKRSDINLGLYFMSKGLLAKGSVAKGGGFL